MSELAHIDIALVQFLNAFARRSEPFDLIVSGVVELNLAKMVPFIVFFWWLWFDQKADMSRQREDVVRFILGTFVAIAAARLLQDLLPARPRPMDATSLHFILPYGSVRGASDDWSSFPSDHAVVAFALATTVFLWSRWLGAVAFAWVTLVICLPRVYVGKHFPSDIAGGALLGVLVMLAVYRSKFVAKPCEMVLAVERIAPAWFYALAFLVTFQLAVLFYDVRLVLRGLGLLRALV
jgi:undecaprenyl-diphosphatase